MKCGAEIPDKMATSVLYACPLCSHSCPSLKTYVSHLRVSHGKEETFNVFCGVSGCREVFRTFSAFNSHIYRHHRVEIGITSSDGDTPELSQPVESDLMSESAINSHTDDPENAALDFDVPFSRGYDTALAPHTPSGSIEAAKMLLQLREGHQVSQAALVDVISCCRYLCTQVLKSYRTDIVASLGSYVEDTISKISLESYDQFKDIDTNYLFEKCCTDNLGCLVSSYCPTYIEVLQMFCAGSPRNTFWRSLLCRPAYSKDSSQGSTNR